MKLICPSSVILLSFCTVISSYQTHTQHASERRSSPWGTARNRGRPSTKTALGMAGGGALSCRPLGTGSAAPQTIVTNADLESVVETSDEWISTRTGISKRRILTNDGGVGIKNLAAEAAAAALEASELSGADIDLVIVATSSPDDLFGDATSVAAEIGATSNCVAFDLTAACSGFLFACVTGGQFLHNGGMKTAVVVGSDALSRWVDWDDRNSCILFGDGAGAMVLQATGDGEPSGLLGYSLHSDGKGQPQLMCGYKGTDRLVATPGDGTIMSKGGYNHMTMNGKEVYKFATREVPTVLEEALQEAGLTVDDVDWLLLHQANIRIMETVAKRLKIPMEKVITNLKDYGNTSAASIPLALDEAVRSGQVKKGDVIACAGFGAGLSWGSAIFRM